MNFIVMDRILLSTLLTIDILEVFLSKAQTMINPLYGIKMPLVMWAQVVNRVHAFLFLLMHFTAEGPPHGEEYKRYFICNTKHSDRTLYWSVGTLMTFQRYHKGANRRLSVKLIPCFLPLELNFLFIEYILLVRPMQSFIVGLCGNINATQQYMNIWVI